MSAINAHGTVFNVTVASVLTPIANLTNIGGVDISSDDIDATSHGSAGYREYIQGLKDAGEIAIEGNFDASASQEALATLLDSGDVVAMSIVFPDSLASWTFNGYVKQLGTEAPFDDKIAFSATIKVTGKPTLVVGS